MTVQAAEITGPVTLCTVADLIPFSGVAALAGEAQIALFYLPEGGGQNPRIHAISNYDPLGKANVLSRGIIGDKQGALVVASPLYKHHYCLTSGKCLEEPDVRVPVYAVSINNGAVILNG